MYLPFSYIYKTRKGIDCFKFHYLTEDPDQFNTLLSMHNNLDVNNQLVCLHLYVLKIAMAK